MMDVVIQQAQSIRGRLKVPGDKSISHRALMLGAMAKGKQLVEGVPRSEDLKSSISCLRSLGCLIEEMPLGRTMVLSKPLSSGKLLNAGNSGTTARLLSGFVAGMGLACTIDGDEGLRRRPMARVADPLRQMGAEIRTAPGGRLPMTVRSADLKGITYRMLVPSAQVKSALLLAGLFAEGETCLWEPLPSRDHTEILLAAMGVPVYRRGSEVEIEGGVRPKGINVKVPGDLSSAAFLLVAAACLPHSELYLPNVGVNPTRTGILEALEEMGVVVERFNLDSFSGEPVADLIVKTANLRAVSLSPYRITSIIDELPIFAVAATQAEGETVVRGAGELRHKESDRVRATVRNLAALGADIEELEDGFVVRGPTRLRGCAVSPFGDHRIAMAMAIAGLIAEGTTRIKDSEVVDVSYPGFFDDLRLLVH